MGVITLLSDFGTRDPYVSQMKAVIISISPKVRIIDVSHEIQKYDVGMGAYILASVIPYFPKDSVHVVVVDPGVGGDRRPIIVETERNYLVGPDNGVLMLGARIDGLKAAYEITNERYMRRDVSTTFHGRDIFAPVAAHLVVGVHPDKIGRRIGDYVMSSYGKAEVGEDEIQAEVIYVDSFGNVILNVVGREIADRASVGCEVHVTFDDRSFRLKFCHTYSEVERGSPLALIGSHGFLELAVNQGSLSEKEGVKRGDVLRILLS